MEPIDLAAKGAAAAGQFLLEAYKNAGITYECIKSPVSAEVHNCWGRGCHTQVVEKRLAIGSTYVWPFRKWKDSECYIPLRAEIDGCNVFGARVRPSSSSRKSWWSTRRWKVVVNSALVSRIPAESSGCPACCPAASCIEFDLFWETSDPFGGSASGNAWIRVCGDGEPELRAEVSG